MVAAVQPAARAGPPAGAGAIAGSAKDAGPAAPAASAAPRVKPPLGGARPVRWRFQHCLNVRRQFRIPVVVYCLQQYPWERTHEDGRDHPVTRIIRRCVVIRCHSGVGDQNERQVLPIVRRRPFRAVLAGHGPPRHPPHLQRLCGNLHPRPVDMTDGFRMCMAAKAQCLQTGVHVGPYSGRHFAGMARM